MSTLVTQLYLLEKYGPRLTTEQLAEVLTSDAGTILNQVSAGTFGVPTYVDGRRRFADVSDVRQQSRHLGGALNPAPPAR